MNADGQGFEQHRREDLARLAPSARSRPFSRVRWATVIENVLKIMNAPTSNATKAKTSMKVRKKPIALRAAVCDSLVIATPVTASALLRQDGRRRGLPAAAG